MLARGGSVIAQEHGVGFEVRTQQAESFAIRGEAERRNCIGLEVCNLTALRSIKRLQPQIVRATFADGIDEGPPIWGELRTGRNSWIGLEHAPLRLRPCVQGHESDLMNHI